MALGADRRFEHSPKEEAQRNVRLRLLVPSNAANAMNHTLPLPALVVLQMRPGFQTS